MNTPDGKLTVSLKHCYGRDKHVLKLSPTSISNIETIFNIQIGSCAGSIQLCKRYLGESQRKELLDIYGSDITLRNSVNDPHGEYSKYMDPAEAALSNHGIYDVVIEYDPPQNAVIQPTTPRKPKGVLEQILQILAPQTA